jgi:hypothetical protein
MAITIPTDLGASRITGVAPLGVHFDASATTSDAATYPFHEVDFYWTFDDPTAGTWTYTGKSKNADIGPIVAHVFETPGTYTVTLACRDSGGASATETQDITVTDPDTVFSGTNTICVNKVGDSDFTGKPTGASEVNQNTWATIVGYCAAGKRVLLKRGSTWTAASTTCYLDNTGPGILGAYPIGGAGAKPIIDVSATAYPLILGYNADTSDWRIMDLEFHSDGGEGIMLYNYEVTDIAHVRLVLTGCDKSFCAHWGTFTADSLHENIFYYECDSQGLIGSTCYSFYGIVTNSAFLGNYFRHEVASNSGHTIRTTHSYKCVWAHNDLGGSGSTDYGEHAMKIHACNWAGEYGYPAGTYGGKHCVIDNVFRANLSRVVTSFRSQNDGQDERETDILCDGNYFLSGTGQSVTYILSGATRTTIRNNIFVKTSGNDDGEFWPVMLEKHYPSSPDPTDFWVYNNCLYCSTSGAVVYLGYNANNYSGFIARNNIICAPNSSSRAVNNGSCTASNNIVGTTDPGWSTYPPTTAAQFAIKSDSAARNAGYTVSVFRDFAWAVRKQETEWDEGAYEYDPGIGA